MDDRRFLRDFDLSGCSLKKDRIDLHSLKQSAASQVNQNIFIFTRTESAQTFFLSSAHSDSCSSSDIYVLQNEDVVPANCFCPADQVYLISVSSQHLPETEADKFLNRPWEHGLFCSLYRIFFFDLWESLERGNFKPPTIVVDDDYARRIVAHFLENQFTRYQNFLGFIRNIKKEKPGKGNENILIYTVDNDEVLGALGNYLREGGKKVFFVNNRLGWQQDSGYNPGECKFMTDIEFAKYLIVNEIGHVIFRNFYDMMFHSENVNKIWIMRQLGVRAVSLVGDTMMEFPNIRFGVLHWLPDTVCIVAQSPTDSYDLFKNWMTWGRLCKSPIVVEFSRSNADLSRVDESFRPEGIMVASNSRLLMIKEHSRLTLFLVPLVREILRNDMKIHNVYFLLIHAFMEAGKLLGTEELKKFYFFGARVSLIVRSLIRYVLIDRTEKAARAVGMPFKIFGAKDWESLFPDSFVDKYLTQEELHLAYRKNIVLIPTPSSSFEGQHPSSIKVLLLGGRVIAPAPFFAHNHGKKDEAQYSSLKRFYFNTADQMEATIRRVMESSAVTPKEKELLLNVFGINSLGDTVKQLTEVGENHTWDKIPGAEEAISLMEDEDKKMIAAMSNYILLLFNTILKNNSGDILISYAKKNCSSLLSQEIQELLINKDRYIEKLAHETDIHAKVLNAVF